MSEPVHSGVPSPVSAQLHTISQILREAHRLDPSTQAALADLIDEVSNTLEATEIDNAKVARLTESAALLVTAVHEQHDVGLVEAAQNRLEHAIVSIEIEAPGLASLARRVAEMLSNVGI